MDEKSKIKRQKRVYKQKLIQRQSKQKDDKEKATRELLQYQTRQRQTPIVNPDDSILERNIKVLEKAMAEHEALLKFREEHKTSEELKQQQKQSEEA